MKKVLDEQGNEIKLTSWMEENCWHCERFMCDWCTQQEGEWCKKHGRSLFMDWKASLGRRKK